ncbi:MAG TPA: type IV pilus assembly protein PilM [Actinomycetota bacterium]|nr:type IV pilus assembly protein PilM [Actinomycetota bacterium]
MAKSEIGLDIGSTAVRAAEVVSRAQGPAVVRAGQVPVPAGAVENGEVRQPELVGEALKELWSRGKFKSKRVSLSVGNQRVVVREVSLPWLPEKELRKSLAFQVQEFIPMSVDEAVLDFDPLGEVEQEGRRLIRILLVAAQKAMINTLVAATDAAKLEPVSIDLTPFALVRAVGQTDGSLEAETAGDEAVVDVGAHVTNICVHDRGVTRFVRILPSGGRDITLALARGLGTDDDVAERLKRGEVVEGGPNPEDVRRIVMQRASGFIDEIRSSLEFYTAQVPGAKIGRVLVTGGGSKLAGFMELLQERIPVKVDRGRVFDHATSELGLSDEELAEAEPVLAVAVGLAMGRRS